MFPDSDIRDAVVAYDSTQYQRSVALLYRRSKQLPDFGPEAINFSFICRYFLVGNARLEPATSAV